METNVNLTREQKIEFINNNMHEVPVMVKSKFNSWDVDKQYSKILHYIELHKSEKAKVDNMFAQRVIKLFNDRNANIDDVKEVIKACEIHIETLKSLRRESLQKQIETLQKELSEIDK